MVTWSALGLIFLGIIGAACVAGGVLEAFAGMMSDAPGKGEAYQKKGCTVAVVGVVLIVAAIVGAVR